MADHIVIRDVFRPASDFAFVVGLMQGAVAIWAPVLLLLQGKIGIDVIKRTKKADFLKEFW